MNTISLIGSFLLLVFLLAFLIVLLLLFYHYLISILRAFSKKYAPFIPVPRNVITDVITTVITSRAINPKSVVYDLGCGDARILKEFHKSTPSATYIGLERDIFPYFLANFNTRCIRSSKFRILKKNFFSHNVGDATHIVTYLFPGLMDELLPKLEKEIPPGTILVSISFPFSNKKPEKVIDLNRSPKKLAQRLYIYRF